MGYRNLTTAHCDSMGKAILSSKEWLSLLGSVGERIEDVKLVLNKSGTMEYDVSQSRSLLALFQEGLRLL